MGTHSGKGIDIDAGRQLSIFLYFAIKCTSIVGEHAGLYSHKVELCPCLHL